MTNKEKLQLFEDALNAGDSDRFVALLYEFFGDEEAE